MGKRGPKARHQVSTEWSSDLAYAVGLIATDGCLSKDGRHIIFTSKDLQLVELFRECLHLTHIKIGFTTSGNGSRKKYLRVQVSDVHFYNWLLGLGLTPKKSLTLGALEIPNRFFFDFLRGCFDGDGTIYAYWDKRWRSSYMYYIAFASASPKYLEWLDEKINQVGGISGKIKPSRCCNQLAFAKRGTQLLFKRMFYRQKLPCLERKFLKAQKIFNTDTLHILNSNARVEKSADSYA